MEVVAAAAAAAIIFVLAFTKCHHKRDGGEAAVAASTLCNYSFCDMPGACADLDVTRTTPSQAAKKTFYLAFDFPSLSRFILFSTLHLYRSSIFLSPSLFFPISLP